MLTKNRYEIVKIDKMMDSVEKCFYSKNPNGSSREYDLFVKEKMTELFKEISREYPNGNDMIPILNCEESWEFIQMDYDPTESFNAPIDYVMD